MSDSSGQLSLGYCDLCDHLRREVVRAGGDRRKFQLEERLESKVLNQMREIWLIWPSCCNRKIVAGATKEAGSGMENSPQH